MGFIQELFKMIPKQHRSRVVFIGGDPNGMNYTQAQRKAKKGWKVRVLEWPAGNYVYWDGQMFMKHIKRTGNTSVYRPTDADKYGGNQWQTIFPVWTKANLNDE